MHLLAIIILIASVLICTFTTDVNAMDQALQEQEQLQEQLQGKRSIAMEAAKDASKFRGAGRLLLGEASLYMGIVKKWARAREFNDNRVHNLPSDLRARADEILQYSQGAFMGVELNYHDLSRYDMMAHAQWVESLKDAAVGGGEVLNRVSLHDLLPSNSWFPNYRQES